MSCARVQDLTPLELVKAARKAHGESIDVGTEEDLWGHGGEDEEHRGAATTSRVTMSMPTHLEIGLLPPTTIPHNQGQYVRLSVCPSVWYSVCNEGGREGKL